MKLDSILAHLQAITEVLAAFPSPAQVPAGLAVAIEKIVQAALRAHAASTGKTVEQVISELHHIDPA